MSDRIGEPCVWCGKPSEGEYGIHRDGMGEGPEMPLCNEHGSQPHPTCEQIWERLARRPSTARARAAEVRELARPK
jgi:hypothetical protein